MTTFLLGCDHRICLNLALDVLCTLQHLGPHSVGHVGIHRVKQCSLNSNTAFVARVSLLPRPPNIKLPFIFFEVFYAAMPCLAVFHLCSSN